MESCVQELFENDLADLQVVATTLLRIFKNIEDHPADEKYRTIKLSSSTAENKLIPFIGGISCLFYVGFEENEDSLTMPPDCDLSLLKAVRKQLEDHLSKQNAVSTVKGSSSQVQSVQDSKWPKWRFPDPPANILQLEMSFAGKVRSCFQHVLCYEKPELQQKARDAIPRDRLMSNAKRKFQLAKSAAVPTSFDFDDFYLVELMDWFRDDCFSWVNTVDCHACGGKTEQVGSGVPTTEDIGWGAHRVELHKCKQCHAVNRFPRYNDPGRLLETRRGRCGEWANTFTLLCRASGYEARHVVDWTDHVWTEVFSRSQDRWLHCDPGEKALDKPLLYEAGWGKKLTYVLAFSKDDLNDVSWRYSADHQALVLRRTLCRETTLVKLIEILRAERQRRMSPAEKLIHQIRLIHENCLFITSKKRSVSAGEMIGRQTGSLEWRLQRSELGQQTVATQYVFEPTQSDIDRGSITVEYYCADNLYKTSGSQQSMYDWQTGLYNSCDVIRNVEVDWNMVYLARVKGSEQAVISWRVDVGKSGKVVNDVKVKVVSEVFHSGKVEWSLEGDSTSVQLKANNMEQIDGLSGSTIVTLSARLTGGDGNNAWQHTQLFRQKKQSKEKSMFMEISFK